MIQLIYDGRRLMLYYCLKPCMHVQDMPIYLSSRIQMKRNPYMLRNSVSEIYLPKPKTEFLKRSFIYASSKIFNSLPLETRQICNIKTFLRKISKDLTE